MKLHLIFGMSLVAATFSTPARAQDRKESRELELRTDAEVDDEDGALEGYTLELLDDDERDDRDRGGRDDRPRFTFRRLEGGEQPKVLRLRTTKLERDDRDERRRDDRRRDDRDRDGRDEPKTKAFRVLKRLGDDRDEKLEKGTRRVFGERLPEKRVEMRRVILKGDKDEQGEKHVFILEDDGRDGPEHGGEFKLARPARKALVIKPGTHAFSVPGTPATPATPHVIPFVMPHDAPHAMPHATPHAMPHGAPHVVPAPELRKLMLTPEGHGQGGHGFTFAVPAQPAMPHGGAEAHKLGALVEQLEDLCDRLERILDRLERDDHRRSR